MPTMIKPTEEDTEMAISLWAPNPQTVAKSQMEHFRQHVAAKYKLSPVENYAELYAWSVTNIEEFWGEVWDFCDIKHSKSYDAVIDDASKPMDLIPTWFPGSRLNFAENLLRFRDDHPALIFSAEGILPDRIITYRDLYLKTAQCAAALRDLGVKEGEVVAALAPNCPQVVICMLAAASIGAIFTTISPDFGIAAVQDRLEQTRPRVLLSCNAVYYNGKIHDQMEKLYGLVKALPQIRHLILLNWIERASQEQNRDWPVSLMDYDQLMGGYERIVELTFSQLPFNHPLYILYSSGTTGKPKCLVHSAGGTLLQQKKEHMLHGDLRREDVFLQYTSIGWMMWHWLVSTLAIGCTIVLYEGSPLQPDPLHLWRLVDRFGVSAFGTSAKYLQHLQEMGIRPKDHCQLSRLRILFSTGSPLGPASFNFVYQHVKSDLLLASITGGTDIISLFAGANPLLPVHRGEIQYRCLGMAVLCYDQDGKAIEGKAGDLVCVKPFPSMPIYFWNDKGNHLYRAAYFDRFPHVWHHGDFLRINPNTGGLVMLGRSDGTLNPAGVRFGSAELYSTMSAFPQVCDSLVVGIRRPSDEDEKVVLFVQLLTGNLDAELIGRIKAHIRSVLSPRHVPAIIMQCPIIPYTLNGKKVEVMIKHILSGTPDLPSSSSMSLANPSSLDFFRDLAHSGKLWL